MCKKLILLVSLVLLLGLVSSASAGDAYWTNTFPPDSFWNTPANWSPMAVPGPGDTAWINPPPAQGPVISANVNVFEIIGPRNDSNSNQDMYVVDGTVVIADQWRWAADGNGTATINIEGDPVITIGDWWRGVDHGTGILNIWGDPNISIDDDWRVADENDAWVDITVAGGSISVGDNFRIGDDGSGVIEISGGTISVNNAFEITGRNGAQAIVTMSGGSVDANSMLLPKQNGTAILNMNGGTIDIADVIEMPGDPCGATIINLRAGTIECGSFTHATAYAMDIQQGVWIINGDVTAAVNADVTAGYITAYNGTGSVTVDFNNVNPAKTTVSALMGSGWQKMDPPPDVDKSAHHASPWPPTCWLATAANMLAGAGYGTGATVQQRADNIYSQLVAYYGTNNGGWTDTAITWWLGSANNIWPFNPYDIVTVYGNKSRVPWANTNGARFIGNELRRCQFTGLSISWPRETPGGDPPEKGHAITGWGDDGGSVNLINNPSQVRVTDSDRDAGGDVQVYNYDNYTNPNPGGYNEGNGWYINYNGDISGDGRNDHPFIKHIITLCPVDDPNDNYKTQKVVGSVRIHQDDANNSAVDLHYKVGTDTTILSYKTSIDWSTSNSPVIQENPNANWKQLTVDWDVNDNPIPYCTWITITTEFVLPTWNSIQYSDIYFTYPQAGHIIVPDFGWDINTPDLGILEVNAPDITGGYVVGSFDLIDPCGTAVLAEYRFLHEYDFNQDPESHYFTLHRDPNDQNDLQVGNFRFGHSYGLLDTESLWEFYEWMTRDPRTLPLEEDPIEIEINWEDRLPYPQGENYLGEFDTPQCTEYLPADLNEDCLVNFKDVAIVADTWLQDTYLTD